MACALHCVIVGLLPGLLAVLGLGALIGAAAEWTLVGTSLALAGVAALVGFRRHQSTTALAMFAVAGGLLLAGRLLESVAGPVGVAVAIAGGVCVAIAHLYNLRLHARARRPVPVPVPVQAGAR